MLTQQGEVAPLHEIPAHDSDDRRVRPQAAACLSQQIQVTAVHGIVLYDHTCNLHRFHS